MALTIEFSPESLQDGDGPQRVMSRGLVDAVVRVESNALVVEGTVFWVAAHGLTLRDDTGNEILVAFTPDLKVVYL